VGAHVSGPALPVNALFPLFSEAVEKLRLRGANRCRRRGKETQARSPIRCRVAGEASVRRESLSTSPLSRR